MGIGANGSQCQEASLLTRAARVGGRGVTGVRVEFELQSRGARESVLAPARRLGRRLASVYGRGE